MGPLSGLGEGHVSAEGLLLHGVAGVARAAQAGCQCQGWHALSGRGPTASGHSGPARRPFSGRGWNKRPGPQCGVKMDRTRGARGPGPGALGPARPAAEPDRRRVTGPATLSARLRDPELG